MPGIRRAQRDRPPRCLAIGADDERAAVVRVVDRAHTRCAVVFRAGSKRRLMERPHLRATLRRERNMRGFVRGVPHAKPELELPRLAEPGPALHLGHQRNIQWRQGPRKKVLLASQSLTDKPIWSMIICAAY